MKSFLILLITFFVISCNSNRPKPIKLNSENCEFCKMTIANGKFGAELITQKGRYYKFDDVACMLQYTKSNQVLVKMFFVNDYLKENELVTAEKCFFLKGGTINSPMRGNIAAFSSDKEQKEFQTKLNAEPMTWQQVYDSYK
ncbi:copper chaperone NosL [Flavobacterium croceum DSM 17960]|uniref:Copper chaperone NosL n=2 Tax=Flavobacterium TaxID=237 RepID=A0A2S4NBM6_9FLAO|nr:copper chaperone NosL [Flavobacterium croceum DSM 17960]